MPRPINPEDLFQLTFLVGADLSPDGTRAVYAATRVDSAPGVEHIDLHVLDVENATAVSLTDGDGVDASPAFSPDGQHVAYMSTRGGLPQLFLQPVAGGEARQLTSLPLGVRSGAAFSPDGTKVAFTAPPGIPRNPLAPYRVSRTIWRVDGMGVVDDALQDIYVLDLTADAEPVRLTSDECMNLAPKWTPDGQAIVFISSYDPDMTVPVTRLRRVTLDGAVTDLTPPDGAAIAHAVLPDERVVYLASDLAALNGERWAVYVVDPASGQRERRGADIAGHPSGVIQCDIPSAAFGLGTILLIEDGAAVLVPVQTGGSNTVVRVALTGPDEHQVVIDGDRVASAVGTAGGKVLFGAFGFTDPGDLYLADLADGSERRLTRLNEDVLAELTLPTVQRIAYASKDDVEIEGWFLSPADADGPLPTILNVHGGPHAAWGHHFSFDSMLLTGAGFGVLQVNHRGSTGYGDEFGSATRRDWGNLDYADVMAGVDHVVAAGLADEDKLGVFGISGGGNLTGWIIGHTDRFKAASPENPLFNWISLYGTSDVGVYLGEKEMGGSPFDELETYLRCSPIAYAKNVTTPTLFMQHDADYRCPAEQTEQFYTALRLLGVPTEMLRFPATGHGGSALGPISHRRAQNDALLDWMNRYVLGKETVETQD